MSNEGILIESDPVIPRFLDACPAFMPRWEAHLAYWKDDTRGPFIDIAELAHFVVESYAQGNSGLLPPIFATAEEFLETGDSKQKEVVTIGLLEDIQTISTHHPFGLEAFLPYLGPLGRQAWREIEQAWEGKASLMDVVRAEQQSNRPSP